MAWKSYQDFIDAAVDRFGGKADGGQTKLAQAVNDALPPGTKKILPQTIQYLQRRGDKPARGSRLTHVIARVARIDAFGEDSATSENNEAAPADSAMRACGPTDESALLQFFRDLRSPSRARVLRFVINEWQARDLPRPGDPDVVRNLEIGSGDSTDVQSEEVRTEGMDRLRGNVSADDRRDRSGKGATAGAGHDRGNAVAARRRKFKQSAKK